MKERSSAADSEPGEERGGFLGELTSPIIKGHGARRPQTVHVASLCGGGKRKRSGPRETEERKERVRFLRCDEKSYRLGGS